MRFIAVFVFAVFFSNSVYGEEFDPYRSDSYITACEDDSPYAMACLGYVTGFIGGMDRVRFIMRAYQAGKPWGPSQIEALEGQMAIVRVFMGDCTPDGISVGQMIKIWVKYLKSHPEEHHVNPNSTLSTASRDVFPCQE